MVKGSQGLWWGCTLVCLAKIGFLISLAQTLFSMRNQLIVEPFCYLVSNGQVTPINYVTLNKRMLWCDQLEGHTEVSTCGHFAKLYKTRSINWMSKQTWQVYRWRSALFCLYLLLKRKASFFFWARISACTELYCQQGNTRFETQSVIVIRRRC